jgi:hypothetical protein
MKSGEKGKTEVTKLKKHQARLEATKRKKT